MHVVSRGKKGTSEEEPCDELEAIAFFLSRTVVRFEPRLNERISRFKKLRRRKAWDAPMELHLGIEDPAQPDVVELLEDDLGDLRIG